MTREGGGHVTLFEGYDGKMLLCRGGNQSDQIKVSSYDPSTVIAYVWPRERPRVQIALDATEAAWVQASLNVLDGAALEVDGDLGPQSREAIAAFQIDSDLPATGLADKKTVAAILADLESWNSARPPRKKR
jgi:peptidoglycan hydrolase-like protein with peptidoglycan-binding domain